MKTIDNDVIEEVSKTLAEYTTGTNISKLLYKLNYFDNDSKENLIKLSTKWKRIDSSVCYECNKQNSSKPFFYIIQGILNPIYFRDNEGGWLEAKRQVNFALRFYGLELNDSGKIVKTSETKTFSDAIERSKTLIEKLEPYRIHDLVLKFCKPELLEKNYYHAIHEASKSTLVRIREMNTSSDDGAKLIEKSFSIKSPSIIIQDNLLQSSNEKNEYNALKHLLLTINFSYRNPTAHEVRIYNPRSEVDAIAALIMVSSAHYLLDRCYCVKFVN